MYWSQSGMFVMGIPKIQSCRGGKRAAGEREEVALGYLALDTIALGCFDTLRGIGTGHLGS